MPLHVVVDEEILCRNQRTSLARITRVALWCTVETAIGSLLQGKRR